ncbi:MAG: hypothetical protein AAF449_19685 [Myxococcota bacterium]
MSNLKDIVCSPDNREQVIADTVKLVDSEVAKKGGISGIAIKTAYKVVNSLKPTLVRDAVNNLLEKFVDKLEPFYAEWVTKNKSPGFDTFLTGQANKVANALLAVTDERAQRVDNATVKKTYEKLRPQGEKNVVAAVPGLGQLLAKYVK